MPGRPKRNINTMKAAQQNILIFSAFMLIAVAGIFYGNAIESDHGFLRVWQSQNILLLLLGVPFLFSNPRQGFPIFSNKAFQTTKDC